MEEYVGALWHKLITDAADKRYPAEAVTLEQIGKTAGILFRSWGGDSGLAVKSATATQHGARRTPAAAHRRQQPENRAHLAGRGDAEPARKHRSLSAAAT